MIHPRVHQRVEASTARRLERAKARTARQAKGKGSPNGARAHGAKEKATHQLLMTMAKEGLGTLTLSLSGRPGSQPMSPGCRQRPSPSGPDQHRRRLHGLEPQRRRSGPEHRALSDLWLEDFYRSPQPGLAPRSCTQSLYPQPVNQRQLQRQTGFKLWKTVPLSNLFSTVAARPGPRKGLSTWMASSSRRSYKKRRGKEVFLLQVQRPIHRLNVCSPKIPEKALNISRNKLHHLHRLLHLRLPGPVRIL